MTVDAALSPEEVAARKVRLAADRERFDNPRARLIARLLTDRLLEVRRARQARLAAGEVDVPARNVTAC